MYGFRKEKRSMSKKTRDILILSLAAALVLDIALAVALLSTTTSDTKLSDTLVSYTRQNVSSAREAATQLSRTGSSYTTQLLAETRQYLYGLVQLNDLAEVLLGKGMISQTDIEKAMNAVSGCESRTLAGQAMDEPLSELWTQINVLQAQAEALAH